MDINDDKAHEHLMDGMSGEGMSNCCSAAVWAPGGDDGTGICMDCKEHCGIVFPCTQKDCEGTVEEGKCDIKSCPSNAK